MNTFIVKVYFRFIHILECRVLLEIIVPVGISLGGGGLKYPLQTGKVMRTL